MRRLKVSTLPGTLRKYQISLFDLDLPFLGALKQSYLNRDDQNLL